MTIIQITILIFNVRAKSKNGGQQLRQQLHDSGLILPSGRRKNTQLSLFTSLTEGEALHLADDFGKICKHWFPHEELANIIGTQHSDALEIQRRISMVEGSW